MLTRWFALSLFVVATACTDGTRGNAVMTDAYQAEIAQWRADRLERLREPYGWLNLVGLYWLEPGVQTLGSGADNSIRLPESAAARIGSISLDGTEAILKIEPGVAATIEGEAVSSALLVPDTAGEPTDVRLGTLAFRLIERNGDYALRLWDFEHPAQKGFAGIPEFATDLNYRVRGTFEAYESPRVVRVGTVIEGLDYLPESPGILRFAIHGEEQTLEVYASGDSFFIVFADATTGASTYPAGRFLYTELPDESGATVIDFNKAYNPPCAFNEFATCPIASGRNRLDVAISAGEKYSDDLHVDDPATH